MSDKEKAVIALGFFDSVHRGHRAVIASAKSLAEKYGVKTAVFTFDGNLRRAVNNCGDFSEGAEGSVFTLSERQTIFKSLGVDLIEIAPSTNEFLSKTKLEFLDGLNNHYDIKGYVCGEDYRFGKGGQGDAVFLKKYATKKNQKVIVEKTVTDFCGKVSTTQIKKLLALGDVKSASVLLDGKYFITGEVFEDRHIGRLLGFPTVNIKIAADKFRLCDGVYGGHVFIDGKKHKSLINYGARPTFGLNEKITETHIVDYSGELYGETLTINFDFYMRKIQAFSKTEDLQAQLKKDLEEIKGTDYD